MTYKFDGPVHKPNQEDLSMTSSPISFRASCLKTLSAVEANPESSNQHEFNGVQALKDLFGLISFSRTALFSIRGESVQYPSDITWYDAREAHPTRTEHRLYFKSNPVMAQANEGDNIVFGIDRSNNTHIILIKNGTPSHLGAIYNWRTEQSGNP